MLYYYINMYKFYVGHDLSKNYADTLKIPLSS